MCDSTDSPNVTSLTVDGHEVSGVHLLNENMEAVVNCYFDQGNPPTTFRLVNQIGQEVSSASTGRHFTHPVRVHRCSHPWPTLHCEGDGSKQNRSVKFLVRCTCRKTMHIYIYTHRKSKRKKDAVHRDLRSSFKIILGKCEHENRNSTLISVIF